MLAVKDVAIMRVLIEHGASLDIKNGAGRTAIEVAKWNGSAKMVEDLKAAALAV